LTQKTLEDLAADSREMLFVGVCRRLAQLLNEA
jgi:hypothetical protein